MQHGKYRFIVGFLVAPLALYAIFVIWPFAQSIYYSFTDWTGLSPDFQMVGFDNYSRMLDDEIFWKSLQHSVLLVLLLPLVTLGLALFFAFMLNVGGRSDRAGVRGVFGSSIYKFIFFFPQVMSIAIVAVIWRRVLQSNEGGMLNAVLMELGLVEKNDPELFLADPTPAFGTPVIHLGPMTLDIPVVLVCLIAIAVWGSVGFYLVLFSAAMQSIPKDIFEAATLDGATRVQSFFKVTLPLLRDHVSVAWVYLGIAALDFYALVIGLTPDPGGGGPNHASEVMSSVMMTNVLRPSRYDAFAYACATGISIAIITLLFAALQFRVTRSRDKIEF